MKKKKLVTGALALAVSVTACGCGQVYELTDTEQAAVVYYSAYAVTKYNKRQPEGIQDVAALEREMALKKEEEEKKKQEKQEQAAEAAKQNEAGEAVSGKEKPEDAGKQYVSLNQALKLGGIDAVYKKYEISSAYTETDSFMVSANQGNELLILYFDLKNNGNKTVKCNILSKMPSFRLDVNGKLSVSADTTILLNDLGTYQGKINVGETKRAVLIFQVQKGKVKRVKNMELEVTAGDSVSLVKL